MSETHPYSNPQQLKDQQYHTSDNLAARIRLHQQYSTNPQSLTGWVFDHMLAILAGDAHILELGSGRGDLWGDNAQRIPAGWKMTLTDLSDGMLADQRKFLGTLAERMRYQTVNAVEIPFANDHFDLVVANHMLYHVPDRARALAEVRRVLKPKGVLFAATNGDNHMRTLSTLAQSLKLPLPDSSTKFVSETFSLQNGTAQLIPHFSEVHLHLFDSHLWVTDAQALIDYVVSMSAVTVDAILREHGPAIRNMLDQRIADEGGIFIEKEIGLFIARGQRDTSHRTNA
ncbi:MAG: class I SAM-dependent methyltransferase [Anaerolineae bacterium]